MPEARVVELTVPASLVFRDLALRVVMESCRLFGKIDVLFDTTSRAAQAVKRKVQIERDRYDLSDAFITEFVSAFSEICNNIPIHAYAGGDDHERIQLRITIARDHLTVESA